MADGDKINDKIDRIFNLLDVIALEVSDSKTIRERNEEAVVKRVS